MGGRTTSNDPSVILREECNRANLSVEYAIKRMYATRCPYQAVPPSGHHIWSVMSALRTLLADPEYRPIVLTALHLEDC